MGAVLGSLMSDRPMDGTGMCSAKEMCSIRETCSAGETYGVQRKGDT